ncbi:MAG: murein biosynthesis integral membrane protein MurJ, partial [Caldilineaceae bacterium]|nr:murein biosynthesis integral membrane protein MurJ [Caldilineaceae bacterium]
VLLVVAGVVALSAQPLVERVIAPGFTPEQQLLTAQLMRWMLLSTIIFGASGLIMGALNAVQHFLLPAAAPVFYNLAIILGAWILVPQMGIYGLIVGVIVGALLHFLVQVPGLWRVRAGYRPVLSLTDPGVREVMRLMGPRVLGLFFVQMHFLVNTILASDLAPGRLSALNYAWLLMLLPQGVFAQSIATAIFPTFAAQVAAGNVPAMRSSFGQIIRTILFLTIPAAVGLYLLRVPLIATLLQRREFTAESTALVAYALQFYAIGLVAHAVVEITVRAFYALHDTWTPVLIGIGAMLLNILFSFWWVRLLGHGGLALANSIATTVEMLLLLLLLRGRIGGLDGRRLATAVGRHLVAASVMAVALGLWLRWLAAELSGAGGTTWIAAVTGVLLAAVVYGGCCLLLRCAELDPVRQLLLRKARR